MMTAATAQITPVSRPVSANPFAARIFGLGFVRGKTRRLN